MGVIGMERDGTELLFLSCHILPCSLETLPFCQAVAVLPTALPMPFTYGHLNPLDKVADTVI